jgi:hypothetical protein
MLYLAYSGPPQNVLIWDHGQEIVYDKLVNGWAERYNAETGVWEYVEVSV